MTDQFAGFIKPKQNWSKLPHILIDALPLIETNGELKCILYLLRHSWGFSEFGKPKRITIDEFMRGRKRRDSTRMDGGTGLSKPTVIDGLVRAEKHGFITVVVDERDKGRVKKLYTLRMEGSRNLTSTVKKLDIHSQETLHPSEKETLERNHRKIPSPPVPENSPLGGSSEPKPDTNPEPLPQPQQVPVPVLTLGTPLDLPAIPEVAVLTEPQQVTDPATPGGQPDSATFTEAQLLPARVLAAGDFLAGIGDFVPGIPGPDGDPGPPGTFVEQRHLRDPGPSAVPGGIADTSAPSTPLAKRDYLTDLFTYAKRQQPGDSDTHVRPKHWETVSDAEFKICQRVAHLWCGGRLPFPGSIEAHCGAAGWLLHDLNGGNLGACIRALDEYHLHYEAERMTFTVAGPKSLVAVLPAFLAAGGGGGEPGVIQVGG